MDKLNMFGKTYNTVGSTDSNFIIKTKGDLKVLWGGKYIDIIKNGKIASPSPNILKEVLVEDLITEDGLYLVSDTLEIIAQVNNTKVNLSNSSGATYISFLLELPDITSDQKYTALSNIGFYYESLEDILKAKISAGLVYSVKEGKIYVIKNSNISEYTFDTTENNDIKDVFDKIAVGELRIYKLLEYTQISSNDIEVFINNRKILTLSNLIDCYTDINLSDDSYILSKLATPDEGFRLYKSNNTSYLEVDSIKWRNIDKELNLKFLHLNKSNFLSSETNIVKSALVYEDYLSCTLEYYNLFKSGQKVYLFLRENPKTSVTSTFDSEQIVITANIDYITSYNLIVAIKFNVNGEDYDGDFYIKSGNSTGSMEIPKEAFGEINSFELLSYKLQGYEIDKYASFVNKNDYIECEILDTYDLSVILKIPDYISSEILTLLCINLLVCISNSPLIKISENNIEVLDRSDTNEDIHTKIGVIKEEEIPSLLVCPEKLEDILVGIYSDNFIGLNSKLYDTIFKKRCDYPKYDDEIALPLLISSEDYNLVVPNIAWVKELLKTVIPSGTITMFNGLSELPDGWAICDGTNGTPNLVGKFIKAVSQVEDVGENSSDLDENNELTLPTHSHSINISIDDSGDLTIPAPNLEISTTLKNIYNNEANDSVNEVSDITMQNIVGGNHTHKISNVTVGGATNTLKIEPRSYSLIFIMKL